MTHLLHHQQNSMDPFLSPTGESSNGTIYLQQHQHRCGQCKRQLQVAPCSESAPFPFPCCTNCRKVFYCSSSHRKSHANKHMKAGCFPAVIQSSSDCGRYWVASRDIAMDEVIYTEKALVVSPNVPCFSPYYPTCLGCAKGTNTSYRCSRCSWPMCGKKCEKIPNHSQNECKIFRKNRIDSNCRPQYYFYIQFLRALLLKERDPKGFAQLMELEAHTKERRQVKEEVFMLKSFYKFLTEDCNLNYEWDVVDHIVGVNRVNCYSADALINGKKRFCTAVFPNLSLINHNCRPNTRIVLFEQPGGAMLMELRASVDIREGEEISQQYISATKGTFQRQQSLSEDWFFVCLCDLCVDRTELSTFFSAIKCVNCTEGYLLPKNPLQLDSPWECIHILTQENDDSKSIENGCGYSRSSENVRYLVDNVDRQAKESAYNPKGLERMLNDLSTHSLHPNHYLIVNIKFGIVDDIVKKINYPTSHFNGRVEYDDILKAVKYTKDILAVTRVICPGRSYCVGILLYFLASCLVELRARNISCKFTDTQLENVMKEAWVILHVEPLGTSYREMTRLLEEKSLILNMDNLSF